MNETENLGAFAKNLKDLTERSGKLSKQIASEIGVSTATYSEWMSGKKYPHNKNLDRLAEYFGIQRSDLTDDHRNKTRIDPQTIEARIISTSVDKMSPENREKALAMMRLLFADYFERE